MTATNNDKATTSEYNYTPKTPSPPRGNIHSVDLGPLGAILLVGNSTHVTVEYLNTKMKFTNWTEAKTAASVIAVFSEQIHDAFTMKAHLDKVKFENTRRKVHMAVTGKVEFGPVTF